MMILDNTYVIWDGLITSIRWGLSDILAQVGSGVSQEKSQKPLGGFL